MKFIDYKPLGSIIRVGGSKKKFMIIARAISISSKTDPQEKFYDYACVLFPEGLMGNQLFYIQDSDISEVYYEGCSNEEDDKYLSNLKTILEKLDIERTPTHVDISQLNKASDKKE